MTEKKALCISLILLIIASVILTSVILTSVSGNSLPVVSLDPLNPVVPVGENLLVNVTIANVTDMMGFTVMVGYNVSLIHAVCAYSTPISASASDWWPVNASAQFNFDRHPVINNTRTYATNYSYVWVGAWGFTKFTGSGALVTINFTGIAMGNCTLDVFMMYDSTMFPDEVEVLDNYADPIDHTVVDGFLTVVPEFPTFIIMPLLLITSLAAAFLGKTFWSRKRKAALIAG